MTQGFEHDDASPISDGARSDRAAGAQVEVEIRISGRQIVNLFRATYADEGKDALLRSARQCFPDERMTDERFLALATGAATLRGDTVAGVSYHDEPCVECDRAGKVPQYPHHEVLAVRGMLTTCPTCEGDGFHPPRALGASLSIPFIPRRDERGK